MRRDRYGGDRRLRTDTAEGYHHGLQRAMTTTKSSDAAIEKLRVDINKLARRIANEQGTQAKFDEMEAQLEALQTAYALT